MNGTAKVDLTMTCVDCLINCQRFGKHRNGLQRFRCPSCYKTFTEPHKPALEGSYISQDRIVLALRLLIEGNSLRSTERITGLDINTLMKILVKAGERCEFVMSRYVRNLVVRDVECDEVWSYIQKKEKRVRPEDDQN